MQTHPAYLDDIIDESMEMQTLPPAVFDAYMSEGWRLLGHSIVRHNFSVCRGKMCRTTPLRIHLEGFEFSKSQRRMLRRAAALNIQYGPIRLTPEKVQLFTQHALSRFEERRPESVFSFLNQNSHCQPVAGMEFFVSDASGTPLACSFIHIGEESVSGTYCFYNPAARSQSLGALTMLLEIAQAQKSGKRYYYHGYVYDVPSQFDYKLNFNNLEAMDWLTGEWKPRQRVPARRWTDLLTPDDLEDSSGEAVSGVIKGH